MRYDTESLFDSYIRQMPNALEIVPWALYSTEIYRTGETTRLEFFARPSRGPGWSNMYIGGMLPNPQVFVIEKIYIYGMCSDLALGEFTLQIGAKEYQRSPAWLMSIRPRWVLKPGILIPAQVNFRCLLEWEAPVTLGPGLSGWPKAGAALQVVLAGKLARPIQ